MFPGRKTCPPHTGMTLFSAEANKVACGPCAPACRCVLPRGDKHLVAAPREDHRGGVAHVEAGRRAAADGVSLGYAPHQHAARTRGTHKSGPGGLSK